MEIERESSSRAPMTWRAVFTEPRAGRRRRITHGNFVRLVVQVTQAYGEVVHDRATTIILLPLAHVLAQGLQPSRSMRALKIVHVGDPKISGCGDG